MDTEGRSNSITAASISERCLHLLVLEKLRSYADSVGLSFDNDARFNQSIRWKVNACRFRSSFSICHRISSTVFRYPISSYDIGKGLQCFLVADSTTESSARCGKNCLFWSVNALSAYLQDAKPWTVKYSPSRPVHLRNSAREKLPTTA